MVRFWKVLVLKREGSDLMSKGHILTLNSMFKRIVMEGDGIHSPGKCKMNLD